MKFIILGCGASMGVPRTDGFFGNCNPNDKRNYRTRCSALIQTKKENVLNINCIEYWYMDWFDGASLDVPKDSISWEICQMFLDREL